MAAGYAYRGVSLTADGKFHAVVQWKDETIDGGIWESEDAAARAHDKTLLHHTRLRLRGVPAKELNFPDLRVRQLRQ